MPDIDRSLVINPVEVEIEDSAGAWAVVLPGIVPALALAGVVAIVLLILRARLRRGEASARRILDRRLAAGDITIDEYRLIRAVIEEPTLPPTS